MKERRVKNLLDYVFEDHMHFLENIDGCAQMAITAMQEGRLAEAAEIVMGISMGSEIQRVALRQHLYAT